MLKTLFLGLFLSLSSLISIIPTRGSLNNVNLENSGDGFALTEKSYESNESFVFTSVLAFNNGQAGGVVFGSTQDDHYWVFNIDRYEDRTKLLYFDYSGETPSVKEFASDYYVGNDKTTESEFNIIKPALAEYNEFNFKVVISIEDEHAYAEFYLDNIKRFGVDNTIDLNTLDEDITYEGGYLGFNVFNGSVSFSNINVGKNDYAYYTELYRNQYHYSQYAHWNNDPNGLVYYNGYYHMFYQTNPFSKQWGPMYWGHARSTDLLHWQELPVALFPDDGNMGKGLGTGYAWSGIAMVYRPGMSVAIDQQNLFPNGNGTGLLGYYTRDGMMQDQVIIYSDDEGLTWTKHSLISQYIMYSDHKIDCRDPSIFPLVKDEVGNVSMWGMALSGGTFNKFWFLRSTNLLDWYLAGTYDYIYPECLTVAKLDADDSTSHYMLSVSSRYYTVGDFTYNSLTGEINFVLPDGRDLHEVSQEEAFRKMEYGEDSYAMQCFNIDDSTSKYYGKAVGLSWFSGLPSDAESGAYAEVRHPWNGGGMTIPVEFSLAYDGTNYNLKQTPITLDNNEDLTKTNVTNVSNLTFNNDSNPLEGISSHTFELKATIENPNKEDIEFRINGGDYEYTSFGYTANEGYFFDRSHTNRAGINFTKHYSSRFTSGSVDDTTIEIYALSDNGSLELFFGDYQYVFYNLTLAEPYSLLNELITSGEVTITSLYVNEIDSVWHAKGSLEEGVIYLKDNHIDLDLNLLSSKEVYVYSSSNSEITYEISGGEDVISIEKTSKGVLVNALKVGEAIILVKMGESTKTITVTVDNGEVNSSITINKENIYSGEWLTTSKGLLASQASGDGFYIAPESGTNFTYSATFDISNAAAAGLLIHASEDMSSYIMTNFDKNANVCKVWSNNGLIASTSVDGIDVSNFALMVTVKDKQLELAINSNKVISTTLSDSEPSSGHFGLNVCAGKAYINDIIILKEDYSFNNEDLVITSNTTQYIKGIYNLNNKNELVDRDFYTVKDNLITLKKSYFALLNENTTYKFLVVGELSTFTINVEVGSITQSLVINDLTVKEGENINIYIANTKVTSVTLNGVTLTSEQYVIKNHILSIDKSLFNIGENEVSINDTSFKVTVKSIAINNKENEEEEEEETNKKGEFPTMLVLIISISSLLVIVGAAVTITIVIKKRGTKNGK